MGRAAEMRIQLAGYDRPARLACRTTTRQADIDGTLTFDPVPGGTRLRWSVRPKEAASLLAPVINWIGGQEQVIWASIKRYLETRQPPS